MAPMVETPDLEQAAQRYLDAILAKRPELAGLDPSARLTENGADIVAGEGYWRTITAFAGVQIFADALTRNVAVMAAAELGGRRVPFALRLKLEDASVVESEAIVSTDPQGPFADVEQLLKPDVIYAAPVPKDRSGDRASLQARADSYWEALEQGDGSIARFSYRADKYDNGAKTTNTLRTLLSPDATVHTISSAINHARQARPLARERFYPIIDEHLGLVVSFVNVDFHPIIGSPRPDAGTFYMMGVFKIVDDEIRIVDEIREILPLKATSGWR